MDQPPPYNPNYPQQPPAAGWSVPAAGPPGYPPPPHPNPGGPTYAPPPPPPVHAYTGGGYGTAAADPEWGGEGPKDNGLVFNNKSIRQGFIRKVFMIVTCQLAFVAALVGLFVFEKNTRQYVRANRWLIHVSYIPFIISYIAIVCCENVRRRFPGNMICLFVLTASLGFMTAIMAASFDQKVVFIALGVTVVTCGAIILFAMQTKYDFTGCIAIMFVVSLVVVLFGFIIIIFATAFKSSDIKILWIVYCGLATLVFMVYLAIDVQLLLGGKRLALSPEDYVLAATQLFVDIVYIFLYLLQIVGLASK